jgi:hypothetical protein
MYTQEAKSFLVLFFKKEQFIFSEEKNKNAFILFG